MTKSLGSEAKQVIEDYLKLPGVDIPAPYFINRAGVRGGLPVNVGKGGPQDIGEEVEAIALRKRLKLGDLDEEGKDKLMREHHLGIDCSGLVCAILNAESKSRGLGNIYSPLKYNDTSLLRSLASAFGISTKRHASVRVLADDKNSFEISAEEILPGDMIVMLGRETKEIDHILLIESVEYEGENPTVLHYVESQEGAGVKRGTIKLNGGQDVLAGEWSDSMWSDLKTKKRFVESNQVSIRRLYSLVD